MRPPYAHASQARQILNDAEDDLRDWQIDGLLGMLSDEGEVKAKQNNQSSNQQVSTQGHGKQKGKQKDADKENRREGDKGSVVGTEGGSIGGSVKEIECGH